MLPSKASITPRILLLFMDIRSPGFSKLFRNKSTTTSSHSTRHFIYEKVHRQPHPEGSFYSIFCEKIVF